MKINDLILQYPTSSVPRRDGICRLRTFVNQRNKIIVLLTELNEKNTSTSITNCIENLCAYITKKGFVPHASVFIEHYEAKGFVNETFDVVTINEKGMPEWEPLTKEQVVELINCELTEFDIQTSQNTHLISEIEQLRNRIDPHIDFLCEEDTDRIIRRIEIEQKQITRYIYENYRAFRKQIHSIREMVESGTNLYNSLLGPDRNLEVDPAKDIKIQAIVIAGRSRDDYEESRKRHDYEQGSLRIMIESWDSWLRKLRRN